MSTRTIIEINHDYLGDLAHEPEHLATLIGSMYVTNPEENGRVDERDGSAAGSVNEMFRNPCRYFASESVSEQQLEAAVRVLVASCLVHEKARRWEVARLAAEVLEASRAAS